MSLKRIAIVGGGPAGAFAATELARAGREVFLFDEKLAWEKPCGGGLTDKAITRWPFLRDAPVEKNWISDCELIAPSGRKASFKLDRQIAIYSRLTLNGLMLDRAREAGANIVRERIVEISGSAGNWSLRSASMNRVVDFVVIAAGARNPFRNQFCGPLGPENFMIATGYYVPGTHHTVQIKFVKGLHGYFWIFPRADHFSAGICGRMLGAQTSELRRILDQSLAECGLDSQGAQFYAHIIPSLNSESLQNAVFSGEGWAVAGDAAGFVDAITGEGLYYALRSAELCSKALLSETPQLYSEYIRQDFLPELDRAARLADRFYSSKWLGGNALERMVQFTNRSASFRDLMQDLFAGTQEYRGLRQRLRRTLPAIVAEAMVSTLRKDRQSRHPGPKTSATSGKERMAGAGNRT